MNIEERNKAIARIKKSTGPLPIRAKQIEAVLNEFNGISNPSPVYFSGNGKSCTRREWADMRSDQRAAFISGR